ASGPPTAAYWAALARDLSGPLVRPGEAGYTTARELFDPRFDSLRPSGVAYCRNPHDVSTCLAFVRRYRVPVAARCGGHSYAGWSSTSGLIVDVTRMAGVSVSGSTATVGAGTRLIDVYNGLDAHGRAVPGGSCPTVGISGLTLGGGIGVVGRAYGLTCDNVKSMQIVTADGRSARPARAPTPTCSGPAAAVAAGTSAWSPRSPSPPTRPGTSSCSSCPGRGRRRPGSSRPGNPGRRTPRTSSGRTCTWPRRPAAPSRPSKSAAPTWVR
ncbi:MAG: FAD-binding oxidoreductase, partial [Streptosporangiaceae bacterium]